MLSISRQRGFITGLLKNQKKFDKKKVSKNANNLFAFLGEKLLKNEIG